MAGTVARHDWPSRETHRPTLIAAIGRYGACASVA
jgi:hypothetical protein